VLAVGREAMRWTIAGEFKFIFAIIENIEDIGGGRYGRVWLD